MLCVNRSLYVQYKEKYNWIEPEPTYFTNGDINVNDIENGWYKSWSKDNYYHRTDGPARMWNSGYKEYWLNGIYFSDIKTDAEWIIKQIIE